MFYFQDRHATSYIPPVKDKSQDWHLLHGEENDFGTVLKFVRRIDTCDINEDIAIQVNKVRKRFKIRNQYNKVPHLTQDTKLKSNKLTIRHHKGEPRYQ